MWYLSHFTSGKFFAIASTRSSQYGIVIEMPFDLVAEVRCFFGRLCASSNAYLQDAVDADAASSPFPA